MMYILFLALLYKLQRGSLRSFARAVMGYDVEADMTPATPAGGGGGKVATEKPRRVVTGYVSDGAASDGSAPGESGPATVGDKSRSLGALGLSQSRGGGTFSGSYERLPSWGEVEEGAASAAGGSSSVIPRSISVNSDGGGYGAGASGTRSLSVNSDEAPGSDLGSAARALLEIKHVAKADVGGAAAGGYAAKSWSLSPEDRRILKRRTILARFTPIVLLSSFVGDLDLITDWTFLHFGLADQGHMIRQFALFFAIVGTVMWALSVTEFSLMSKLKTMWKGNPLSRLQHVGLGWQLLANVFLEDLPQFIITVITRPTSVTGVLNLTASGFSLCAKIIHGFSSQRAPSLSTQFKMIDQDPAVTRNLFRLRDEAKKQAKAAEKLVYLAWTNRCSTGEQKAAAVFQVLQMDPTFVDGDLEYMRADLFTGSRLYITSCDLTGQDEAKKQAKAAEKLVYLAWTNRCSTGEQKAAAVFQVLQMDPTFVNGDLEYMRADLFTGSRLYITSCDLTGSIPPQLGDLSILKTVVLARNELSGSIPPEFGKLSNLTVLDLSENSLSGAIPVELAKLGSLTMLDLSTNALTGPIPAELHALKLLTRLMLAGNQLTGPIPRGLSKLKVLQELDLSNNQLTGPIPRVLGTKLSSLLSFSVGNNMLTGRVPMSLAKPTQLKSLVVANNMLAAAAETEEELKPHLHPECVTDFLPQEEPEEEPSEEEEEGDEEAEEQTALVV
eukprot:g11524.t1